MIDKTEYDGGQADDSQAVDDACGDFIGTTVAENDVSFRDRLSNIFPSVVEEALEPYERIDLTLGEAIPEEPEPEFQDEADATEYALGRIHTLYGSWTEADQRSHNYAHGLLAAIFAASQQATKGSPGHLYLSSEVKAKFGTKRRGWTHPTEKPADELILASLMGIEGQNAKKSVWLAVLRLAVEEDVGPAEDAFRAWLNGKGGIDGAYRSRKPTVAKEERVMELMEELSGLADELIDRDFCDVVKTVTPVDTDSMPENMVLGILQQIEGQNPGTYRVAGVIADAAMTAQALRKLKSAYEASGEATVVERRRKLAGILKDVRTEYRQQSPKGNVRMHMEEDGYWEAMSRFEGREISAPESTRRPAAG